MIRTGCQRIDPGEAMKGMVERFAIAGVRGYPQIQRGVSRPQDLIFFDKLPLRLGPHFSTKSTEKCFFEIWRLLERGDLLTCGSLVVSRLAGNSLAGSYTRGRPR